MWWVSLSKYVFVVIRKGVIHTVYFVMFKRYRAWWTYHTIYESYSYSPPWFLNNLCSRAHAYVAIWRWCYRFRSSHFSFLLEWAEKIFKLFTCSSFTESVVKRCEAEGIYLEVQHVLKPVQFVVFSAVAVCGCDMCKEFHVFESAGKRCGGQTW